ncbi:helix-turn-helix transcriptional regulator [Nocardia rhamnosiphila]
MHGREKERAVLTALLQRARSGNGGALVVHGDPGIGKTTLLDSIAEEAVGLRLLRATAVEPEAEFCYATVHQLLLPVLDGVDRLPPPQAAAMKTALGLAEGRIPGEFLVGLAILTLLSELARDTPVLCVVDDIHWADRSSRQVLQFVARRLAAEPIGLVLASRTEELPLLKLSGVSELPLRALDRDAARLLLAERCGDRLSPNQQEALLKATAGNPMAIVELPAEALCDSGSPVVPLPLTDTLQNSFLRRVRLYEQSARRLLLLIAAAGRIRRDILNEAAAELDHAAPHSLDSVSEFIVDEDLWIVLRHPLIRSAVYHGAAISERRDAHRALAAAIRTTAGENERYAWHLGHSVDGPDETVAAQLDRVARRAGRVSSVTSAALLSRAADLSTDMSLRSRRLIESAGEWWRCGDSDRTEAMLEIVDAEAQPSPGLRRRVVWLRASAALHTGIPADAVALLRPLIPEIMEAAPQEQILFLMLFGGAGLQANSEVAWADLVDFAERIPASAPDAHGALLRLFRAACRTRLGRPATVHCRDVEVADTFSDPFLLCWVGELLSVLGRRQESRRANRRAVQHARRMGAVGALVWALECAVTMDTADGQFGRAAVVAEEGYQLAEEIGHSNVSCWFRASMALLAALGGDDQRAYGLAHEAISVAVPRQLAEVVLTARRALGLTELAKRRPESALVNFRPPRDFVHPDLMISLTPDLVEAAAQARHLEYAVESLAPFLELTESARSPVLSAVAARCRALVATPDIARDEFQCAAEWHERDEQPMEYARTQLLFGEMLRRQRRRAEARRPLRAAFDTFQVLGAVIWAERARAELRAAGAFVGVSTTPPSFGALTPQEARIAGAVASGASNREIAAEMFLSPRTVDYHLRKIFTKLGLHSRTELVRLALTGNEYRR